MDFMEKQLYWKTRLLSIVSQWLLLLLRKLCEITITKNSKEKWSMMVYRDRKLSKMGYNSLVVSYVGTLPMPMAVW